MTIIAIFADTHIPKRARELPGRAWHAIDSVDVVFHAGDWVDAATLDEFETRARRLVGVAGNNDGSELRARLPRVARVTVDGLRIAVVHETGAAAGRELRADENFPNVDLLIFGHSHIPWDSCSPGGLRLINPGSPTDRRRQPAGTFVTAEIIDSRLRHVEFVRLPPRGQSPPGS